VRHSYNFDIYLNPEDLVQSASIALLGYYEIGATELFRRILRPGSIVVDVGASIGWFSLLAASLVGKDGLVVAFEPEPNSFSLLSKSVLRNSFGNVRAHQECLSDTVGTKTLYLSPNKNKSWNSVVNDLGAGRVEVPSVTLEAALCTVGIQGVDLLKIDVEGSEPEVLQGAGDFLRESRIRNIIMEWSPHYWVGKDSLVSTLLNDYEVYQLSNVSPFLLKRIDSGMPRGSRANLYFRLGSNR
jgi:FkbM family methyltransferase